MKSKTMNARLVWKQIEDSLVPRLRLSVIDRAVYCYLVRHSWLEGKARARFSIKGVARGIRVSESPTRQAVRRLVEYGALRLVERTKLGHMVEVRLPEEIRAGQREASQAGNGGGFAHAARWEEADFLQNKALREAIHARGRGRCFYCLRRTKARMRSLDHVVPRVEFGRNSYRNLVSCCVECNSRKGGMVAKDFLRWLYREDRLSTTELKKGLLALEALGSGRLKPEIRDGVRGSHLPTPG